jgi:hypothetical protein
MQQKRMRLESESKTRKRKNAIMRKFSTTKGFYDEYFIKLRTAKSNGSL